MFEAAPQRQERGSSPQGPPGLMRIPGPGAPTGPSMARSTSRCTDQETREGRTGQIRSHEEPGRRRGQPPDAGRILTTATSGYFFSATLRSIRTVCFTLTARSWQQLRLVQRRERAFFSFQRRRRAGRASAPDSKQNVPRKQQRRCERQSCTRGQCRWSIGLQAYRRQCCRCIDAAATSQHACSSRFGFSRSDIQSASRVLRRSS
jgi:hypothetical protein